MSKKKGRQVRPDRAIAAPLRFTLDPRRGIGYPPMDLAGTPAEIEEWPTLALPQTKIFGASAESVLAAADSGDMTDIQLADGAQPYGYHLLVDNFAYQFVPVPTLTLELAPYVPQAALTIARFVDATISDWTTDKDYAPTAPDNELCEFSWDGHQNFLLEFLSFKIIVQAVTLEFHPVTQSA